MARGPACLVRPGGHDPGDGPEVGAIRVEDILAPTEVARVEGHRRSPGSERCEAASLEIGAVGCPPASANVAAGSSAEACPAMTTAYFMMKPPTSEARLATMTTRRCG